jgi:hypothetical protein
MKLFKIKKALKDQTKETQLIRTWEIPENWEPIHHPFELPVKGRTPPTIKKTGINRILNRKILDVVQYLGSYGMGGPGFFGIKLEKLKKYPEEWLVLRIWGGTNWLHFNGSIIECHPDQKIWKPYGAENVKIILLANSIKSAVIRTKSCVFKFQNGPILELKRDPKTRPVYWGNKESRILSKNDNLNDAWILTSRSLAI